MHMWLQILASVQQVEIPICANGCLDFEQSGAHYLYLLCRRLCARPSSPPAQSHARDNRRPDGAPLCRFVRHVLRHLEVRHAPAAYAGDGDYSDHMRAARH